jgi:hypothetical protein
MCVVMSEELNSAFTSVFEFLIHSFIKQLAVKAVPTRESSHECICRILKQDQSDKLLKQLFTYAGDKDRTIRTRISNYVLLVCETWEKIALQKNIKEILKYINQAQGDGESLVRKSARLSVVELAKHFPAAVAQFYQNIEDLKLKKELEKMLPPPVLRLASMGTTAIPSSTTTARRSLDSSESNKPSQSGRTTRSSYSVVDEIKAGYRPAFGNLPNVLESSDAQNHNNNNNGMDTSFISQNGTARMDNSARSLVSSRRAYTPVNRTARELNPEEKELRARMLASSDDLAGLNLDEALEKKRNGILGNLNGNGAVGVNQPGDLIRKLEDLRKRVQMLPNSVA